VTYGCIIGMHKLCAIFSGTPCRCTESKIIIYHLLVLILDERLNSAVAQEADKCYDVDSH